MRFEAVLSVFGLTGYLEIALRQEQTAAHL